MASSEQTTKRHLNKPQPEDFVNVINDICDNMDNLDDAVPDSRKVNGHALNGDITVSKSDVGLGNVDNTSDANKPLSNADKAVTAKDYANLTFPVAAGTHCIHDNKYYVANQNIQSSESWTAAHWTQTTIGDESASLKSALSVNGLNRNKLGSYLYQKDTYINSSGQLASISDWNTYKIPLKWLDFLVLRVSGSWTSSFNASYFVAFENSSGTIDRTDIDKYRRITANDIQVIAKQSTKYVWLSLANTVLMDSDLYINNKYYLEWDKEPRAIIPINEDTVLSTQFALKNNGTIVDITSASRVLWFKVHEGDKVIIPKVKSDMSWYGLFVNTSEQYTTITTVTDFIASSDGIMYMFDYADASLRCGFELHSAIRVKTDIDDVIGIDDVRDAQNKLIRNVLFGNDIKNYLFKEKSYIDANLEIQKNALIDLYRFPLLYNGFVLINWTGDTSPINNIGGGIQITFELEDGTYTRANSEQYYIAYTDAKSIVLLSCSSYKYAILTMTHEERNDISLSINTLFGSFQDQFKNTGGIISMNADNTPSSKAYLINNGTFSKLTNEIVLWKQMRKGDSLKIVTVTGLSFNGTFTGVSNTRTRLANSYTATEDGIACIFDLPGTPLGHQYIPKEQEKVDVSNVIGLENVLPDNAYNGLNAVAFGTSLTYRGEEGRTGGYLQYLRPLSGMTIDNQGLGSATILAATGQPEMMPMITGYTGWSGERVCILEGFVNDWYYNAGKLGTWKDSGQTTVCGCVRYAINYIWSQNANLTIFLILDHFGKNASGVDQSSTAVNSEGETQYEWWAEIEKVALSMGVRVIREYEVAEINENTPQYLLDNIHLNALGAEQSGRAIWSVMKQSVPNYVGT